MAVLVFVTPISAFAADNSSNIDTKPKIGEVSTTVVKPEGREGSFVGIPKSTINKVQSEAALASTDVSTKAAYWGTITTKATGYTTSLDLDWKATFNDYVSGGILTADLQKWEAGRGWYVVAYDTEEYIYSSSLKNPQGQFTFKNLKGGKYRVEVYGEFIGRNTVFMMLEVPVSNETWVGLL